VENKLRAISAWVLLSGTLTLVDNTMEQESAAVDQVPGSSFQLANGSASQRSQIPGQSQFHAGGMILDNEVAAQCRATLRHLELQRVAAPVLLQPAKPAGNLVA
jgi:hypothetical protein